MSTRFYFTATAAPAITPAYDANWNKTANAVRRLLSRSKLTTINATSSDTETNAAAYNILNRQLISKPLVAQTITGTVKGQMRASETDPAADMCHALVVKVVSGDGLTVRGILLSDFPAALASEFDNTGLVNRNFPASKALGSVTAQDGDYLVVELGVRAFNTVTTSMGFSLRYQDGAAVADLPEDETTNTDLCPWIEFSQDLLFQDKLQVYQAMGQVEYEITPSVQVYQTLAQVEYDLTRTGSGSASLKPLTASGRGSQVSGHGAAALRKLTAAGEGIIISGGVGVAKLAPLTAAGAGYLIPAVTGVGEASLEAATARGTGLTGPPITGTIDASLAPLIAAGYETLPQEGAGAAALARLKASGSGRFIAPVIGTGAARLKPLTALGEIPSIVTNLITRETASGGFLFGGPPGEHDVFLTPETDAVQSKGGFLFGGRSRVTFLVDSDLRPFQIVSFGGFLLRGSTTVTWVDPGAVPVLPIVGQGGFIFGGSDTEVNLVDPPKPWQIQSDGGFLLGGSWKKPDIFLSPDIISIFPDNNPGGFLLGGRGIVEHLLTEITSIVSKGGGFCLAGYGILNGGDEVSETWALNGFTLEPSLYASFDFKSYAMFQGQAYGCREDGIYLLEGPDDNGEAIVSGVRLGPMNFGTERQKRLRLIRPGAEGVTARVAAGGEEEVSQQEEDVIPVSRNVEGNEFVLDLQGFEQLGFVEVLPLVLMKR